MSKEIDINRLNYESFVIDYLDGGLGAVETACFIAFLENNPDIKDEVAELSKIKLITNNTSFKNKSTLKRKPITSIGEINEDNYEELFIAHFEGDLNKLDEDNLVIFIDKNPELVKEFNIHSKLQVQPSITIFEGKEALKRRSYIGITWYSSVAAAVLLLFLASWFFLNKQDKNMQNEFTQISKLDLRNSTALLKLNQIEKIELKEKQIEFTPQFDIEKKLDNAELIAAREIIYILPLESKVINEQLVDSYIYIRLDKRPQNNIETSPKSFNTELAFAEQPTNDKHKGLFARIFSNQFSKISTGVKANIAKRKEYTDPAYIKVIDGGLLVFNTLTGNETSTVKTYNQNGELLGYQIDGREVMFNGNFAERVSQ